MEEKEIIEKIRKSWNRPCIFVTKDGKYFLASPQEFIQDYLRYGVYNSETFAAAKGDDYLMLDILTDQIELSELYSVVSWKDLEIYIDWIKTWEDHNKKK